MSDKQGHLTLQQNNFNMSKNQPLRTADSTVEDTAGPDAQSPITHIKQTIDQTARSLHNNANSPQKPSRGKKQETIDSQTEIQSPETISLGVVGSGKIADRHLGGYSEIDNIELTVTDIIPEKAENLASKHDISWNSEPSDIITDPGIDAIDVCIPVTEHQDVITEAFEHGKHVFCEKPLAQTLGQARQIQRHARDVNRILMVGYLYRLHPAFQNLYELLNDGVLGDPYLAIFRVGGQGSHRSWKHKSETGGGVENEMLVHMVDLMYWYFGAPTSVEPLYSDIILEEREINGESINATANDISVLRAELGNDMTAIVESDFVTPSYMNYVEVHGTNGSVITSLLDYFPTNVYLDEPRGSYEQGHNRTHFEAVDLFQRELSHFIDSVRNEKPPEVNSVHDAVEVRRIIDAV